MGESNSWLSRPCCCRRQSSQAYIYLYSPTMAESSSSSSSPCLVCLLFGLCLAFIVILAAVVIYHLNTHDDPSSTTTADGWSNAPITKKRQLPDFVNVNIDPCEHFYDFVCDKWTRKTSAVGLLNENDQKWIHIRHHLHDQLLNNQSYSGRTSENDPTASIYRFYQLCERQSPSVLIDELERYFANLNQEEPYRSYLTLFNRTNASVSAAAHVFFFPRIFEPFFRIQSISSNHSKVLRTPRRPLPSALSIFPNVTILNQTALKDLTRFDREYQKLLANEKAWMQSYETQYNSNAFLVRRISSFSNYSFCLPSKIAASSKTTTTGLGKLIELLRYFLESRLGHLNTKSIDKQIRMLETLTDDQALVEHLRRLTVDLRTIHQITGSMSESNSSCIFDILDRLLDPCLQLNELPVVIRSSFDDQSHECFISADWPYLILLHDRLIRNSSIETLVNYAFFDSYRHLVYPYYQPHVDRSDEIRLEHDRGTRGFTYSASYPNVSCTIQSCWDVIHCYHPSLLNRVIYPPSQKDVKNIRNSVGTIIDKFRQLTEQSDHLYGSEKKSLLEHFNRIQIFIGHYPNETSVTFDLLEPLSTAVSDSWSYFDYVRYLSNLPYDQTERSYFTEPIYFPSNHSLYLPYGFLLVSNQSLQYQLIKFFFKIARDYLSSNPYQIECFLQSSASAVFSRHDEENEMKVSSHDEELTYIYLRSKFILDRKILLDEYLWPFMSASIDMKRFLIDYTATNYCPSRNGIDLFKSNNYLLDDVYLMFQCPQASSIKQSKCTIV